MIRRLQAIKFPYLLAILVFLVIFDGILTLFVYRYRLGYVSEGNGLLSGHLYPLMLWLKLAGSLICAGILWHAYRSKPGLTRTVTWGAVLGYALIVLWNIGVGVIAEAIAPSNMIHFH